MKVMCIINRIWQNYDGSKSTDKDPQFGEVCEVVATAQFFGEPFYSLKGYWPNYRTSFFIPLSEIDEMALSLSREEVNA